MTRRTRIASAALAAAACAACSPADREQQVEFKVPVSVREVGTGAVEDRVTATGSLRALQTAVLRTDTGGQLRIARGPGGQRLAEGDRVAAGQTIAEVTGEEVRIAARTEATSQRYAAALRDYESKKRLHDDGLLSALEFRQYETALAEARLEHDRSRLTEQRSSLVTPIAGVILRMARDEQGMPPADGQLVPAGYEVARVAPLGGLIADVDLVGPDIARARQGLPARVRHQAWHGQDFAGRVARLAPAVDPATRTLRAEISVANESGELRPGMFVDVTIVTERREDVLVIPREALAERGGRKVVFVLEGQQVSRRDVVPGLGDDEIVEIRQGLKAGERIVVRGLETLTDGTRVQVTAS
jgi:RND family efflux transporter MFP subunit